MKNECPGEAWIRDGRGGWFHRSDDQGYVPGGIARRSRLYESQESGPLGATTMYRSPLKREASTANSCTMLARLREYVEL